MSIMTAFAVYSMYAERKAGGGHMCEACSGSSQDCVFHRFCGERRRSSGVFGSTEPVLKMFGIVWVLVRFLLLVDLKKIK